MGQILFSILMLASIAVFYMAMSVANIRLIEPVKLMLLCWAFGFILLASGAVMFQQQFSMLAFVVLFMSLAAASVGGILGSVLVVDHGKAAETDEEASFPFIMGVLMIGGVIYIILAGSTALSSTASILSGGSTLSEMRSQFMHTDPDTGAIGVVRSFARTTVLLSLMIVVFQGASAPRLMKLITYAGTCVLVLEGLSAGGRSHIAFAILYFELARAFKLCKTRVLPSSQIEIYLTRSPVRWYHIVLAVAAAYFLFIYFPMSRNVHLADQILRYLNARQPAAFGAWVDAAADNPFLVWVRPLAYGSSYFSEAIVIAIFYIQNTDISHFHLWGFYDGKFFVKLLSIFDHSLDKYWNHIDQRIAFEPFFVGYQTNPWGTIITDLLVDFGLWGTPVFMFFFGYLSQFGFRKLMRAGRPETLALAGVITVGAAVSGAFGTFTNNLVSYPLFLMMILIGVSRIISWGTRTKTADPSALPQT